jgi:acyl-CoA thioester hydrolase
MSAVTVLAHRVRYHEVDQQGVMFNARYFEIADVAQIEYFRVLGWDLGQLNRSGFDPAVVHVNANFSAPARFDELLDITIECLEVGSSSFTLDYSISRGGTNVANFTIVHVNVDTRSGKAVNIPDEIATALRSRIESSAERNKS